MSILWLAKVDSLETRVSSLSNSSSRTRSIVAGAGPSTPSPSAAVEGFRGCQKSYSRKSSMALLKSSIKQNLIRQHLGNKRWSPQGSSKRLHFKQHCVHRKITCQKISNNFSQRFAMVHRSIAIKKAMSSLHTKQVVYRS